MTEKQIEKIPVLRAMGLPIRGIARAFGVHHETIRKALKTMEEQDGTPH